MNRKNESYILDNFERQFNPAIFVQMSIDLAQDNFKKE